MAEDKEREINPLLNYSFSLIINVDNTINGFTPTSNLCTKMLDGNYCELVGVTTPPPFSLLLLIEFLHTIRLTNN